MNFFKTISLDEAVNEIKNRLEKDRKTEEIYLWESLNRVLSEDVVSSIDLPSFNRSTVDGYAVKAREVSGASEFSPIPLTYIGEGEMGEVTNLLLKSAECMYIPTGGMLPEGSDAVVMIEDCESLADEILINRGVSELSNVILKGTEVTKGEVLIKKGEVLKSSHIGVLSSIGKDRVKVYKKLKFSIISTGDEIVGLGKDLKLGEVYDINTHIFSALIKEGFGEVVQTFLVRDDLEMLSKNLESALEKSDIVLISGGSSVGIRDFTVRALEDVGGEVFIHGLSLKPGKPTIVAKCKGKFVFGMPGHPQSGVTVFKALVEPVFLNRERVKIYGELAQNIYGDPGKRCFINAKLEVENGKVKIYPLTSKSSMIRPILDCDGIISIPEYKEGFYKGEIIEVILND